MNRTDLQLREAGPRRRPSGRLPAHCRSSASPDPRVYQLKRDLRRAGLTTVCEEARCPNLRSCFARGTATFMLLGDVCTRTCRFCSVATGRPRPVDAGEPARVAEAVATMRLSHAVLTSVARDDLPDGGAGHFARTVNEIRARAEAVSVEILVPDFQGDSASIDIAVGAGPDVFNHNVETVPALYRRVRPGARYQRSLDVLAHARSADADLVTKSGLMLGLGETEGAVYAVLRDLRSVGVDCLTLGQYLRPTLRHLEVVRYLEPAEFDAWAERGRELGFRHVASGPLVRSSFRADAALRLLRQRGGRPHAAAL